MKSLEHIYNEQNPLPHDYLLGSSYSLLYQQEFLNRLSEHDIKITSQTLRNWQRNHLLSPISRSGQAKKRGLQVVFCEFSLAEAFAIYSLTNSTLTFEIGGNHIMIPKYSLLHIAMARVAFCKAKYTIPNFPKPPEACYKISSQNQEELFQAIPPVSFNFENDSWQLTMPQVISGDELAKYLFFQGLYSAWFFALQNGCRVFFSSEEK